MMESIDPETFNVVFASTAQPDLIHDFAKGAEPAGVDKTPPRSTASSAVRNRRSLDLSNVLAMIRHPISSRNRKRWRARNKAAPGI
jgi:hypothetical protein